MTADEFYVIVCSTHGDGELPTGARPFLEGLETAAARTCPVCGTPCSAWVTAATTPTARAANTSTPSSPSSVRNGSGSTAGTTPATAPCPTRTPWRGSGSLYEHLHYPYPPLGDAAARSSGSATVHRAQRRPDSNGAVCPVPHAALAAANAQRMLRPGRPPPGRRRPDAARADPGCCRRGRRPGRRRCRGRVRQGRRAVRRSRNQSSETVGQQPIGDAGDATGAAAQSVAAPDRVLRPAVLRRLRPPLRAVPAAPRPRTGVLQRTPQPVRGVPARRRPGRPEEPRADDQRARQRHGRHPQLLRQRQSRRPGSTTAHRAAAGGAANLRRAGDPGQGGRPPGIRPRPARRHARQGRRRLRQRIRPARWRSALQPT